MKKAVPMLKQPTIFSLAYATENKAKARDKKM